MKIVVTGATGYIGSSFTKLGRTNGHDIVAASRHPLTNPAYTWIPFDISSSVHFSLPTETAAVVHLAVNTLPIGRAEIEREIETAKSLVESAKEIGAKFVFVSSQTARREAPTAYGRTKWCIEQEVLSAGGWVVRPGQVYGGELRGLFGMLVKLVRQLPVLPFFVPGPKVQPIHVDDLSEGLLRITERDDLPSGVYCLGESEPVSFTRFLGEIARSRLRIWRGFVPAPVGVINGFAHILGESLRSRLGLERLRSLFDLPVMATGSDLELLGITLRPLRSGMHPSGNDRRRCILQEGQALFTYVLKTKASGTLLRRYTRAIEKLRDGRLLALPQAFIKRPELLAIVDAGNDSKTEWGSEFLWRLDSATILAEATPIGAQRFLGLGDQHGFTSSLFRMARAVVFELGWRLMGLLLFPLVRIVLHRPIISHK